MLLRPVVFRIESESRWRCRDGESSDNEDGHINDYAMSAGLMDSDDGSFR